MELKDFAIVVTIGFMHLKPFPLNCKVLQNHLQASGNVLDAAIRAYKDYLAERSKESASAINYVPSDNEEGDSILSESESDGTQHLHILQPKYQH